MKPAERLIALISETLEIAEGFLNGQEILLPNMPDAYWKKKKKCNAVSGLLTAAYIPSQLEAAALDP